jgi:hypothetical protein
MVGWVRGRPKVRGRWCGALMTRADGVGSAVATSCGDGLARGEAPIDDDSWHTMVVARWCLRWLIGGRGTVKKSSSSNVRIDRGGARWRGREVERCGDESHEEEEGKRGFVLSAERIRVAAGDAREAARTLRCGQNRGSSGPVGAEVPSNAARRALGIFPGGPWAKRPWANLPWGWAAQ